MQTGPIVATALLLTLMMPVASAEEGNGILGALVDEVVEQVPVPSDPVPEEIPEVPEVEPTLVPNVDLTAEMTPEEWADFLEAVDAMVEAHYPQDPRIGHLAAEVVNQLIDDDLEILNRTLVYMVVSLLPTNGCLEQAEQVPCIMDLIYAITNIRFEADGLQPFFAVSTASIANQSFGFKAAAIGTADKGSKEGSPFALGHVYFDLDG